MQNEFGLVGVSRTNFFVEIIFLPIGYPLWLTLSEISPHREGGIQ